MSSTDIVLSRHATMQAQRRRISLEDIALALQYGEHVEGEEEGTREACIELDGRPIAVVYDAGEHRPRQLFYVITVLRRRCRQ